MQIDTIIDYRTGRVPAVAALMPSCSSLLESQLSQITADTLAKRLHKGHTILLEIRSAFTHLSHRLLEVIRLCTLLLGDLFPCREHGGTKI